MGVVEEGGKVAGGFIAGLSSQPVLLVQSAILAGVVFILYAQGTRSFTERETLLKSVFDSQANVREILSQCIVPPNERKRSDFDDRAGEIPLPQPRPAGAPREE